MGDERESTETDAKTASEQGKTDGQELNPSLQNLRKNHAAPTYAGAHSIVGKAKPGGTASAVLGALSILLPTLAGIVLGACGLRSANKALKDDAACARAKAGKAMSIVGIALSLVACLAIATMLLFVIPNEQAKNLAADEQAAGAAADACAESLVSPDKEERSQISSKIAGYFKQGVTLEQLGISTEEVEAWLFDGNSCTRTQLQVQDDAAQASYEVTSRSIDELTVLVAELDTGGLSNAKTLSGAYRNLGKAIKRKMRKVRPETKTVELKLEKSAGAWSVDEEAQRSFFEAVYYSNAQAGS